MDGPRGRGGEVGEGVPGGAPRRGTGTRQQSLGRYGEDVALRHLEAAGLVLVERNWRCGAGEIDLVLRDGATLVVCEVKTRSSAAHGSPHEAVTPAKVARMRRLAAAWLGAHDVHVRDVRLDLVGVLRPRRGPALVDHVRGLG